VINQIIVYTKGTKSAAVYTIDKQLNNEDYNQIGRMFINPLTQVFEINPMKRPKKAGSFIEIGFLPGVTDNAGATAQ